MTFIQLPISATFINLDQINLVECETIDEKSKAIVRFNNSDKLMIFDNDAKYLIRVLEVKVYG